MEKYLPYPPHLADAGVAAVAALEVDELAAVVPDLDHGHGVVVGRAQVVHLHRGGDVRAVNEPSRSLKEYTSCLA